MGSHLLKTKESRAVLVPHNSESTFLVKFPLIPRSKVNDSSTNQDSGYPKTQSYQEYSQERKAIMSSYRTSEDSLTNFLSTGGSLCSVKLLPDGLSDILGHQGMLGLDFWEGIRHLEQILRYLMRSELR